ncbi:hypothetical protein GCM10010922_02950 [Microbacterium sorbitolivorans]|uniref:Uncharacterized protein n=1 Tax=Microbacterium sorbitolivorans TaxID=1867410 RepID=A0A367Y916_9MICO|nr:hypothetical protein [Microbacterium sorbitolivorans]RCK61542.1 hypothetical protein DTO57_02590 [Microbacterium sorbitolivorans]GGF31305.1 hypothetical protein GCM10010922_02950 [Microbacterium sorbitolivorans]
MRLDKAAAASLIDELALLRKNDGFIQRRLTRTPIVDEVLRHSLEEPFERLKSRFISAIHSLEEPGEAELLLDIFALSPETEGVTRLQQRRQIHGRKINRKTDTVASREEAALSHLHSRLVMGTYAQSPLVLHVPEMHGGIVYEHTATMIIVEDKKWRRTLEHYRFANMHGELDYVTVSRSHDAWIDVLKGGDFKVNPRPVPGAGWNDHFWHLNAEHTATEPMRYGEVYDLRFHLEPEGDDDAQDPIKLASRAFHQRSLLASIEVKFIGQKPRLVWKFEQVSPFARPTEANEYNAVTLDERGVATLRMRDVHGGLFSGISWDW